MFKPSHLLKARIVTALLHLLVISSLLLLAVPISAQEPPPEQPTGEELLDLFFPPHIDTTPAVPSWNFPEFTGNTELRPLPDAFDIVERPAWFDGVPATIRPFPSPSVGTGGPDDGHADLFVFFYADGTPAPQFPLLEAVPVNAAPGVEVELGAELFSANWEITIIRVVQDYVPGTIQSILEVDNPRFVLEALQTNMFFTFPIIPQNSTIPGLELNNLNVDAGIFEGSTVLFVEYEIEDEEFSKLPRIRIPGGCLIWLPPSLPVTWHS